MEKGGIREHPLKFDTTRTWSGSYANYLYRKLDQDFTTSTVFGYGCAAACELESRCQFALSAHTERSCYFGDLTLDSSLAVAITNPNKSRLLYSLRGKYFILTLMIFCIH